MKKVLLLALASVMMLFVACNKNEDNDTTTTDPAKALVGTSWYNHSSTSDENTGECYITNTTYKFVDASTGTCNISMTSIVWGDTTTTNNNVAFNYTFDGKKGTISYQIYKYNFTMTDDTHFTITENKQVFTKK